MCKTSTGDIPAVGYDYLLDSNDLDNILGQLREAELFGHFQALIGSDWSKWENFAYVLHYGRKLCLVRAVEAQLVHV